MMHIHAFWHVRFYYLEGWLAMKKCVECPIGSTHYLKHIVHGHPWGHCQTVFYFFGTITERRHITQNDQYRALCSLCSFYNLITKSVFRRMIQLKPRSSFCNFADAFNTTGTYRT